MQQVNTNYKGERILKLLNEPSFIQALRHSEEGLTKEHCLKILDHITLQKYNRDLQMQKQKNSLQFLLKEQLEARMLERQNEDFESQQQLNFLFNKVEVIQQQVLENKQKRSHFQQQIDQEISKNRNYEVTLNGEMNGLNSQLQSLEQDSKLIDERNAFLLKAFRDIHLYDILSKENAYLKNEVITLEDKGRLLQTETQHLRQEYKNLESSHKQPDSTMSNQKGLVQK